MFIRVSYAQMKKRFIKQGWIKPQKREPKITCLEVTPEVLECIEVAYVGGEKRLFTKRKLLPGEVNCGSVRARGIQSIRTFTCWPV